MAQGSRIDPNSPLKMCGRVIGLCRRRLQSPICEAFDTPSATGVASYMFFNALLRAYPRTVAESTDLTPAEVAARGRCFLKDDAK